jgi:hypothetical protein
VTGNAPLFLVGAKYDGLEKWRSFKHVACGRSPAGLCARSYIILTTKVSESRATTQDGWALHSHRGASGSFPGDFM